MKRAEANWEIEHGEVRVRTAPELAWTWQP